jgi:hypothetical protein
MAFFLCEDFTMRFGRRRGSTALNLVADPLAHSAGLVDTAIASHT